MLFFTSLKKFIWKHKTFQSLGGHESTYNQKFFGDLQKRGHSCAKKVGYLSENLNNLPFRPYDPIMKALASM